MHENYYKNSPDNVIINNKTNILFINTEGDTDKQWN